MLGVPAGSRAGKTVWISGAMEDAAPVEDHAQPGAFGRVHIVGTTWTVLEGAEGRRLAARLAEVLMPGRDEDVAPVGTGQGD